MSMIGAIRCRATLCDDPEAYEEGGVNEMIKKCAINASSFHAIIHFSKIVVENNGFLFAFYLYCSPSWKGN